MRAPETSERADGWVLGEPDLTLEMEVPYHLAAAEGEHLHGEVARDVFRYFVIPVPLEQVRYVRAVEFQPSDRRVVHHVTMSVDHSHASRLEDRGSCWAGRQVPCRGRTSTTSPGRSTPAPTS
jgi:hypothetical protein